MRGRFLALFIAAAAVSASCAGNDPDTQPPRSTVETGADTGASSSTERCAISTFTPEDMWIIRNTQQCGVTFTSKRGDVRLAMIQVGTARPASGTPRQIGGRQLQPADSDYDRTVGTSSFQFVERGATVRVSTAGLTTDELDRLVAGIQIVSSDEWQTRYPKS